MYGHLTVPDTWILFQPHNYLEELPHKSGRSYFTSHISLSKPRIVINHTKTKRAMFADQVTSAI